MSTTIDQKVVEMKFDNKQFEKGIQTSLSSIDNLKKGLNFEGATKGLDNINNKSKSINMSSLSGAVETVKNKFSALEIMSITALANITNSAVNAGKRIVSALTIDPIKSGFQEYETQINAVQTILANTSSKGTSLDQVNAALDELNHYADMTIYNFTEMTRNIGTFTAAGVDLDTSVQAIKGIANLAAVSGSTSQQASTAMYQLSQALSSGTVKLQDWNSVVNAGMGGQVFQDSLKETARVHGIAIDQMITDEGSFRETLSKGWLTSDILTETLSKFTGDLNEEQLKTMGYTDEQITSIIKMGQTANDAATKVKTFTQLFDTLKEAAQSGWTQSWEIIVGDFEEAKSLLTKISDTFGAIIGASAEARNSMLQGWKELGGRTVLIEAARNAFEGVLSIIKPVKEAFREIFPPMTAQQLYNITEGLKKLTAHLKLSEKTSDNLKRTFKGLFAVIDIVKQAFVSVIKAVLPVTDGIGGLADGILGVTASCGDWLVKLDDTIKKTDIFDKAVQKLVSFIKPGLSTITELFNIVSGSIKNFADAIKEKYDIGGFVIVHSILERIITRTSEVSEATNNMKNGVTNSLSSIEDAMKNSKFIKFMSSLLEGIKTIGLRISKSMGVLVDGFIDDVSNINYDSLMDTISGISLGAIALAISNFLKSVTKPLEGIQGVVDGVTGILDGVRGCFEAYQTQLKAKTLFTIASAIGILTASILVLSLIDSAKLGIAIAALTGLFAELMTSMAIFTKISGKMTGTFKTVTAMIGMSIAILILASAMKKISELDSNGIAKGMYGIAGLSLILVVTSEAMSKNSGKVMKGAINIVVFSTAIKILASACADLAQLSWDEMAKGLIGVGVLMGEVSIFLNTAKFSRKAVGTATGILILASALKVLASACSDFASMSWSEIRKGLTSIGVVLGEIAIFTNITGNAKRVLSTGVALIAIAAAMKIMASAIKDFGNLQSDEIGRGLIAMAGALATITLALNFMPKNMISIGIGLAIVSGAITTLASALELMGGFSWEEIGKGLVVIGGALAELAVGLKFMNGTLSGSASLLVASSSLAILAPVLKTLGNMKTKNIVKGLLTLAGAFAVIGVAGLVLSPIIPSILALGGAISLIGVGIIAIGAGLAACGVGLQALSIGFTALSLAGTAGATAVVASLTIIIMGIANMIPALIGKVGEGIIMLCNVIAENSAAVCNAVIAVLLAVINAISKTAPQLIDLLFQIITKLLTTLKEYTPLIVQTIFDILIACLEGIANNISLVVQTGIDIVLGFIDGISQKIPDIIQSGFDLLLSFINGITDAINENSSDLAQDMRDLFIALLGACVEGLAGGVLLLKDIGSEIMNSGFIQGIKDKVSDCISSFTDCIGDSIDAIGDFIDDFEDMGINMIKGLVKGIGSVAKDVTDSVKSAVSGAVDSAKNFLGIHSPSRVFMKFGKYVDEGFINGVNAYSGKVAKSTENMASKAVDTMNDVVSSLANDIGFDDYQPTIKPVLDLANIQNGSELVNGMFDNNKLRISDMNADYIPSKIVGSTQVIENINNSNNESVVDAISSLRNDIDGLSNYIGGLKLVLDSGAVVGNLVEAIDSKLGKMSTYKNRRC